MAVTGTTFLVALLGILCEAVDPLLVLLLVLEVEVVGLDTDAAWLWEERLDFLCLFFLGGMLGLETSNKRIRPKENLTIVIASFLNY